MNVGALDYLKKQAQVLKKKTKSLSEVHAALDKTIHYIKPSPLSGSNLPWKMIFKTIAHCHNLKMKEVDVNQTMSNLNGLKEYLHFEDMMRLDLTEKEKKSFDKKWANLAIYSH